MKCIWKHPQVKNNISATIVTKVLYMIYNSTHIWKYTLVKNNISAAFVTEVLYKKNNSNASENTHRWNKISVQLLWQRFYTRKVTLHKNKHRWKKHISAARVTKILYKKSNSTPIWKYMLVKNHIIAAFVTEVLFKKRNSNTSENTLR